MGTINKILNLCFLHFLVVHRSKCCYIKSLFILRNQFVVKSFLFLSYRIKDYFFKVFGRRCVTA